MTYKIELESGMLKLIYMSGLTEDEAERICSEHDWYLEDDDGFVWDMGYCAESEGR